MYPINLVETDISIHAPTRGATRSYLPVGSGVFISIHAPTRGATRYIYTKDRPELDFNPRSYKRSDCRGGISSCVEWNFNPRSYKRSDLYHSLFLQLYLFQSTLLQEERQLQYGAEHLRITISIHAPTRGATLQVHCTFQNILISIHAPTRGATPRGSAS